MSTIVVYEDLMEITNQGNEDAQEELGRALKTASDFKYALDEHAIVAITDADGTISYVNDRFCDISGFSESELMGQTHRIINSSYHTKEFFNDLRTTIAGGSVWRGEIRNKRNLKKQR